MTILFMRLAQVLRENSTRQIECYVTSGSVHLCDYIRHIPIKQNNVIYGRRNDSQENTGVTFYCSGKSLDEIDEKKL